MSSHTYLPILTIFIMLSMTKKFDVSDLCIFSKQCLIAMPSLNNSVFEKSVIYITHYSSCEIKGLMLTLPLTPVSSYKASGLSNASFPVLYGGPENTSKEYVLSGSSLSNVDLTIAPKTPSFLPSYSYIYFLGECLWTPKQLISEIVNNDWLLMPATFDFLFGYPLHSKWNLSLASLGVDPAHINSVVGYA